MAEEFSANEKYLVSMITELHSRINNLDERFKNSKDFMYRDIADLQKRCNEIETPDVHFKVVRR